MPIDYNEVKGLSASESSASTPNLMKIEESVTAYLKRTLSVTELSDSISNYGKKSGACVERVPQSFFISHKNQIAL